MSEQFLAVDGSAHSATVPGRGHKPRRACADLTDAASRLNACSGSPGPAAAASWIGRFRGHALPVLLLAGWALYISVVTASNLSDLASSFGWERWAFRSGNLAYIHTATKIYFNAPVADQVLLAVVTVWEGVAAVLCWRAATRWVRTGSAERLARAALLTLTTVFFSFGIATEVFIAYDRGVDESAYWALAVAVMASLGLVELSIGYRLALPSNDSRPEPM